MRLSCGRFRGGCSPTRNGGTSLVLPRRNIVKATRKWREKCRIRLAFLDMFACALFCFALSVFIDTHHPPQQQPRNKSKKGGVKKRVYFWGGISWFCKTPGVAWTADDIKVIYRHTKNLCRGTVFQDEDDEGNPCVFRVVQTRAAGEDNYSRIVY